VLSSTPTATAPPSLVSTTVRTSFSLFGLRDNVLQDIASLPLSAVLTR
jgi:hypothetical protein